MAKYELPALPYPFEALEPFIDAKTMEIHHGKHHATYVAKLNEAIQGSEMEKLSLEELLKFISKYPVAVRNNGGGHFNHSFFWNLLKLNEPRTKESTFHSTMCFFSWANTLPEKRIAILKANIFFINSPFAR